MLEKSKLNTTKHEFNLVNSEYGTLPILVPDKILWLRGLGLGGVNPIRWNVFNKSLYFSFVGTSDCLSKPTILDMSVVLFRYAIHLIIEMYSTKRNTLTFFLNAHGGEKLKALQDASFLRYNVQVLNSWYPGYFVNNIAFEKLLERISVVGLNRVSKRLKFVWNNVQEIMFLRRFPDLFIILGTSLMNSIAVREAFELAIPVIGVISPDTTTSKLYIALRWPATSRLVDLYYRIFYEAIYTGLFKIFTDEVLMLTGVRESVSLYMRNLRGNTLKEYRFRNVIKHYATFKQVSQMARDAKVFSDELAILSTRYRNSWSFFLRNIIFSLECTVTRWLKQKRQHSVNVISHGSKVLNYKNAILKSYHIYTKLKRFYGFRELIKKRIRPVVSDTRLTRSTWRKYLDKRMRKVTRISSFFDDHLLQSRTSIFKLISKVRVIKRRNTKWKFNLNRLSSFFILKIIRNKKNLITALPNWYFNVGQSTLKKLLETNGRVLLGTKHRKATNKEVRKYRNRRRKLVSARLAKLFIRRSKKLWKRVSKVKPKRRVSKEERQEQNLRKWVKPNAIFGLAMANLWEELETNPFPHKPYLHNRLLKLIKTIGGFKAQGFLPRYGLRNRAIWTKYRKRMKLGICLRSKNITNKPKKPYRILRVKKNKNLIKRKQWRNKNVLNKKKVTKSNLKILQNKIDIATGMTQADFKRIKKSSKRKRFFRLYLAPYLKSLRAREALTIRQRSLLRNKWKKNKGKKFLWRLLSRVMYRRTLKHDTIRNNTIALSSTDRAFSVYPSIGFNLEGRFGRRGNRSKKLKMRKIVTLSPDANMGYGGIDLRFFSKLFKKLFYKKIHKRAKITNITLVKKFNLDNFTILTRLMLQAREILHVITAFDKWYFLFNAKMNFSKNLFKINFSQGRFINYYNYSKILFFNTNEHKYYWRWGIDGIVLYNILRDVVAKFYKIKKINVESMKILTVRINIATNVIKSTLKGIYFNKNHDGLLHSKYISAGSFLRTLFNFKISILEYPLKLFFYADNLLINTSYQEIKLNLTTIIVNLKNRKNPLNKLYRFYGIAVKKSRNLLSGSLSIKREDLAYRANTENKRTTLITCNMCLVTKQVKYLYLSEVALLYSLI